MVEEKSRFPILAFVIACIAIFIVRFLYAHTLPFFDEVYWFEQALHGTYMSYIIPHPPLAIWAYNIFYTVSHYLRYLSILLNLATFIFSFLILREFTDDKESNYWFYVLFALTFWNVLSAVVIDTDPFMTFFTTAAIFFFIRYDKSGSRWPYAFCSIIIGLSLLTKITGLFILIIIGLYTLAKTRSLSQSIRRLLPMALISFFISLLFPLIFYKNLDFVKLVLTRSSSFFNIPLPLDLAYILLWGTPLLFIFLILSYKVIDENNNILFFWIFTPIFIYLFGQPFHSPYDRYLMVIVPPLMIVGAMLIPKYIAKSKKLSIWTGIAVVSTLLLILDKPYVYINNSMKEYFHNMISFKWGFLFPITGTDGPSFGVPFAFIMVISIISFICLAMVFMDKYPSFFFGLILVLGLAFNIYYIINMEVAPHQPDVAHLKIDMLKSINLASGTIYTNEKSFRLFFPDIKIVQDEKNISGDVFIFDYPLGRGNKELYTDCEYLEEYADYNQTLGYHYRCLQ